MALAGRALRRALVRSQRIWLRRACVCACAMAAVALAPSVAAAENGGEVVGWGRNLYGQLGARFKTGSGGGEESPVGAVGLSNVTAIASGRGGSERGFGLALLSDGEVESWGGDSHGTLGDGSLEAENENLETKECTVEADEEGSAEESEEGVEGQEAEFGRKVHVAGLEHVTAISAAAAHAMALLSNDTVATWGEGEDGEHGNKRGGGRCETGEPEDLAQVVQGLTDVEAIASGGGSDFAVQAAPEPGRRVLAWGRDLQEGLDIGGPSQNEEEQEEQEKAKWKTAEAEREKAEYCRFAQRHEEKGEGQAAEETYTKHSLSKEACKLADESPLPKVGEPGKWLCATEVGLQRCSKEPRPVIGTEVEEHGVKVQVTAVSAGFNFALALYSNGTVRAWGANDQSELGTAGTKEGGISKQAEKVVGLGEGEPFGPAVAIAAGAGEIAGQSLALLANGKVVGWGADNDGQLGQSEPEICQEKSTCVKTPKEIPGLQNIVAISAGGSYSLALNSSGELYAFGRNKYGRLGIGSTEESVSKPTLVKGIGAVGAIAAGELAGYAILRSGVAGPAALLTIKSEPAALTVSWSSQLPSAESETGIHVCYRLRVRKAKCLFQAIKVGKEEEEAQSYKFRGMDPEQPYTVTVNNGKKTRSITGTTLSVTGPEPPIVVTGSASSITQTSGTLNGTVNPNGGNVSSCDVEYNESPTSVGASTKSCGSPGSGSSPEPVSVSVTGLTPNATYYFRVDASNAQGTSEGDWEPFTTLPDPPTVVTGSASAIAQTSATLNGTVNPNGREVSECKLEYGASAFYELTKSYESSAPCTPSPGSGSRPVAVSASITGLPPNTEYHFRISATNAGGTSEGSDQTLRTLVEAAKPPGVETKAATGVAQTSATLNATVNPNGGEVSECRFEYGTTAAYGTGAPCSYWPGSGSTPVSVSAPIAGLAPNTEYHFRISATNAGGTSYGAIQAFTTFVSSSHEVLPLQEHKTPPIPDAEVAGAALTASATGTVNIKVSCPAGETSCTGTITLKTLTAVVASAIGRQARRPKAAILTLATGSFKVAGGRTATIKLHLTTKARALLARTRPLRARATIVAHDPTGAKHTTQTIVTIRAAKTTHGG